MYAASGPSAKTVELLLEAGAEVNAQDNDERFTPLMYAAAEGQLEVVQLLLKHKADKSMTDIDNDTARNFAIQNNHLEVAEALKIATLFWWSLVWRQFLFQSRQPIAPSATG